jgi:single-stranded DNA-binding protein
MAAINSVTLVGRNSAVELIEFPSGTTRARFDITVKRRDEQVFDIPCEAWGKLALQAAEMEEGLLIGLIGSLTRDKLIRLDRLERLGPARV